MQKNLIIEWQHVGADISTTCVRCTATGTTLLKVIEELKPELSKYNIHVEYKETVLTNEQLPDSNRILINGKPFEEYLKNAQIVETPCQSCACIVDNETAECRAIEISDEIYESIPDDMIRNVLMKIITGDVTPSDSKGSCCCQ
jgi:hypothetical protein